MNKPQSSDDANQEKRRHPRHTYERALYLDFPGQPPLLGDTRDVSLTGVFLRTTPAPTDIVVGQEGFLRLETKHNAFCLPCKVVYVTPEGLALNLMGQEAAFGLALAMDAFEQIKMPDKPVTSRNIRRDSPDKPPRH